MRLMLYRWLKRQLETEECRRQAAANTKLNKQELEFLPAALEIVDTPPSPLGRATAWLLISLFTVVITWACIGQIEEVAVATGKVIPSGYAKTIQAEDKGVVKHIRVKNGSTVKAGDVLIELDTTLTGADVARLTTEQTYYRLELARLLAEQTGTLFAPAAQAAGFEDREQQLRLYRSRQAEYQARLAAARQAVQQAQAALDIGEATRQKLALQLEIAVDQEEKMRQLAAEGAVSQFQHQNYRERRITLQQDLAAQSNELVKAGHVLQQSRETLNSIVSEHERELMTGLVEGRRQLQGIEEELKKAREKERLSRIVSPIDGTVNQLVIHTIGAVVTPAQELMLIVPDGTNMEIEAWVNNKDIGFIYADQDAEIKVETFNFQKYGTLEAKLTEISSDAVEDKERGLVYRAVLRTDSDHFALANGRKVYLTPGMAVTAEIKTRQKRIIEYFMDPFIKYRSEGLRER
ncbi:MAG: HlyD family type I secretion periplasmic adaptor subunit [Sporomusaceae bacterium]|nr:HlyD family type I secretion periplasmic adaptor subunit [Sporomusaceae bacterium]